MEFLHAPDPTALAAAVNPRGRGLVHRISVKRGGRPLRDAERGLECFRLVFVSFSVLEGVASLFRPVIPVLNPNPIPIHDVGVGTLLAIELPSNGSP